MKQFEQAVQAVRKGQVNEGDGGAVRVYPASLERHGETALLMVKDGGDKFLLAVGSGELFDALQGEVSGDSKVCPLSTANRHTLNRYFPYTAPRAFGTQIATIGLGDRLGIASPGHLRIVRDRDVRPILAQQSIRELNLTGRDYNEVLNAASFAVFQEGYKDGFGADGDHLKVESDIQMSLDLGFTMLTLDCSEKIDNTIEGSDAAAIGAKYGLLPADVRARYEERYLGKTFEVAGMPISFTKESLMKDVLIYGEAIGFMKHVYATYIQKAGREVDFEISIDETATPTAPASHYFVANELYADGIAIYSMAPRFCGEFQKGIDYIGDIGQFEQEMQIHAAIADHFGYKLSIHSGSDKFSVFPIIAQYTKGRFHVKTAGTNWLEAMRTLAQVNPQLYRRMHQYGLEHFEEATAYYHVKADLSKIKPLADESDAELPKYMDDEDARQMIHITYGILLQAKDDAGRPLFKDEFFRTLSDHEDAYSQALEIHIGKHLQLLGK